ncbi:MAG: carboxyltransferase domain-containing protein [Actinomycetota bacterium]|nr:carboxyltransferase domain-containing protein [Actinomycetota bacterium]MDA8277742.1 carboxyltransferase domain-containing protein [Actinomycetota bacterium]
MVRARRLSDELIYLEGLSKEEINRALQLEDLPHLINLYPFGDKLLIEYRSGLSNDQVEELTTDLLTDIDYLRGMILEGEGGRLEPSPPTERSTTHYFGFILNGEDLAELLSKGITIDNVIAYLEDGEFIVEEIAFAPGFLYLSGLPQALNIPRRATPRASVPPRSLAIGGPYLGVYSISSPGGWNIIGSVIEAIEDLVIGGTIKRGDKVKLNLHQSDTSDAPHSGNYSKSKFHRSDISEIDDHIGEGEAANSQPIATIEVAKITSIKGSVTVQGGYRNHLGSVAISRSGPVDPKLLEIANRAVGNPIDAPSLEIALGSSIELSVIRDAHIIFTHPGGGLSIDGREVIPMCVIPVATGQSVVASNPFGGERSYHYLSVGGGFTSSQAEAGEVASFDTLSKIGLKVEIGEVLHRHLRSGPLRSNIMVDEIAIDVSQSGFKHRKFKDNEIQGVADSDRPFAKIDLAKPFNLIIGPDERCFSPDDLSLLDQRVFLITARKSRSGQHLEIRPKIYPTQQLDRSHPIAAGALQVNPDGNGFVIGRDHPTSGGYPVLGYFSKVGLAQILQMPPGHSFKINVSLAKDVTNNVEPAIAMPTPKMNPGDNQASHPPTHFDPPKQIPSDTHLATHHQNATETAKYPYQIVGYLPLDEQLKR